MAIGLNGSVGCCVDPSLSPSPTFVGLLMFLSLVALSGLEFLVAKMFGCELQRRLILEDCRVRAFQETSIRRSPNSMRRMISGHSGTNQLNSA
jgi:hypothetical protein